VHVQCCVCVSVCPCACARVCERESVCVREIVWVYPTTAVASRILASVFLHDHDLYSRVASDLTAQVLDQKPLNLASYIFNNQ
jgi:hypothetical protein